MFPARLLVLVALLAAGGAAAAASAPPAPPAQRIVSLIPSLTEDLFALGVGPAVVGVSVYTDYPPAARALPVVSGLATVNAERIVQLHPDLIVGIASQETAAAELQRAGLRTVLLRDDGFDDIFANLRALGALTGRAAAARTLAAQLHARTAALVRTVRAHRRPPAIFVVLGTAPIFTVGPGSYIAHLIELAGGRNAAQLAAPYGAYGAESLLAAQPDLLVADPTVQLPAVLDRPPWNALRAVRAGRIAYLPDPAILERPGPRYNDGLAWLIAALNALPT